MFEFKLPQTSDDFSESLMVIWYKSEGEPIQAGEVLVEVQTEKATFELDSPVTGIVAKILVDRAQTAAVGDVIAWIEENAKEQDSQNEWLQEPQFQDQKIEQTSTEANVTANAFVSMLPRVRKLAEELGVDPHLVMASGPHGRILEEDIRRAVSHSTGQQGELDSRRIATRRAIADRMTRSLQQTAQLTLQAYADVTELNARRKRLADTASWNDWILRAVALALRDHPKLNGQDAKGAMDQRDIHLGVAVDTEDGLFVPVIRHADQLSLQTLHNKLEQLIKGVQSHSLSTNELTGSTFTVTNLGVYGVNFFTPIINYPEIGILGVGQIEEYPIRGSEQEIIFHQRLPLSLTFDHKVLDGVPAARFLQTLSRLLREPEALL